MNIITQALRAQAVNKDARGNVLVMYTQALAVAKVNAGIEEGITDKPSSSRSRITKFAKFIETMAKEGEIRDRKTEGSIQGMRKSLLRLAIRRLVTSVAFSAARGVLRLFMLGARLAGSILWSAGRVAIRGIGFIARVLARGIFLLPRLLLMNPIGLAVTATAVVAVAGYKYYKYRQEKNAEEEAHNQAHAPEKSKQVFEGKETGVVPSTSATSEVQLSPKQKTVRGLRNNNPGNLDFHGQPGASREILPSGTPGRFAKFGTQAEGLYALATQIQRDIGGKNKNAPGVRNTISSIVAVYAPAKDNNNIQKYTHLLSEATGLKPYDVINPRNSTLMTDLLIGIIRMENGSCPYTRAQVQEAVTRSVAYADRGFRNFNVELTAEQEREKATAAKPTTAKAPEQKPAAKKEQQGQKKQEPAKAAEPAKAEEDAPKKGSGPMGFPVPGVDDTDGFIIPMSGIYTSGTSESRTVTMANGKTKTAAHKGIDIAAPTGTPVFAAHTGEVIRASNSDPGGYGNNVVIKGDDKYYTWYAHLTAFRTKVGERLKKGAVLGLSGGAKGDPGAGSSSGAHLHFAIATTFSGSSSNFVPPERLLVGLPTNSERKDMESKGQRVMLVSSAAATKATTDSQYLRQGSKVKVLRI